MAVAAGMITTSMITIGMAVEETGMAVDIQPVAAMSTAVVATRLVAAMGMAAVLRPAAAVSGMAVVVAMAAAVAITGTAKAI